MGEWYLEQLEIPIKKSHDESSTVFETQGHRTEEVAEKAITKTGIAVFSDMEFKDIDRLISFARERLASLEAEYTAEKHGVDVVSAKIFKLVRNEYRERDRLKLIVQYRREFLNALLSEGQEHAEDIAKEYSEARTESDANYEQANASAEKQQDFQMTNSQNLKVYISI